MIPNSRKTSNQMLARVAQVNELAAPTTQDILHCVNARVPFLAARANRVQTVAELHGSLSRM